MGKHKKFLRSEKAKVKLKGHKLKAAQNVTKTDFKVRKILIPEQLKNVKKDEVTGLKHHNVVDCLARLRNSSSPEALNNLKEIILHQQQDFNKHLESIIKIVANLSLSIEKPDRKMCFKLLDLIFTETPIDKLRPFFPILVTYLKCAMTHIKSAIQEDSLLMLDVLLNNASSLVAAEKDNILPPYLNMISKMRADDKPERTLSLQLGNKITTIKWRRNVLERLISFLKCIGNEKKSECLKISDYMDKDVNMENLSSVSLPITHYQSTYFYQEQSLAYLESQNNALNFEPKENSNKELDDNKKIQNYAEMIVPLLFETWLEMKPSEDQNSKSSSLISNEAAYMLKIIMDIMIQLWSMIERNEVNRNWFIETYSESFSNYLLGKFPYFQNVGTLKTESVGGEKCFYQNLNICFLFLIFYPKNQQKFNKFRSKVFSYVNDCISFWKVKDNDFNDLLTRFISKAFLENNSLYEPESRKLFGSLIEKYDFEKPSKENDIKLMILCNMIEKSDIVDKSEIFSNWLPMLFNVLCRHDYVAYHVINTFNTLAKHQNQYFVNLIEDNADALIANLFKLKVSGCKGNEFHWKKQIANFLYWANDFTTMADKIRKILESNESSNKTLCRHVKDIVDMKVNE